MHMALVHDLSDPKINNYNFFYNNTLNAFKKKTHKTICVIIC